jgi:hypothetical protein
VVIERPHRPEPRYVFRDADPRREYVTRVFTGGAGEYRQRQVTGRTSQDVGGPGSVPVPGFSPDRSNPPMTPPSRAVPSPPLGEDGYRDQDGTKDTRRRRLQPDTPATPKAMRPPEPQPRQEPKSTGEPELRRRKP